MQINEGKNRTKKCEPPLKRKQIKDVGREREKRRTHNNWKTESKCITNCNKYDLAKSIYKRQRLSN